MYISIFHIYNILKYFDTFWAIHSPEKFFNCFIFFFKLLSIKTFSPSKKAWICNEMIFISFFNSSSKILKIHRHYYFLYSYKVNFCQNSSKSWKYANYFLVKMTKHICWESFFIFIIQFKYYNTFITITLSTTPVQ